MIKYLILLFPQLLMAATPMTFPVFLRAGFSTVLEFEESPTRVVLGDTQSFQVEKLDRSVVVKTLVSYATSNMFVYFKTKEPKLFVLTASEDAEPTYYKKFEPLVLPTKPVIPKAQRVNEKGVKLRSLIYSPKKDFLTVEVDISADQHDRVLPRWDKVRLVRNNTAIVPYKLWSERKEVQKDSSTKARFIFSKPNLPKNLAGTHLVIPLLGSTASLTLNLSGAASGVAR